MFMLLWLLLEFWMIVVKQFPFICTDKLLSGWCACMCVCVFMDYHALGGGFQLVALWVAEGKKLVFLFVCWFVCWLTPTLCEWVYVYVCMFNWGWFLSHVVNKKDIGKGTMRRREGRMIERTRQHKRDSKNESESAIRERAQQQEREKTSGKYIYIYIHSWGRRVSSDGNPSRPPRLAASTFHGVRAFAAAFFSSNKLSTWHNHSLSYHSASARFLAGIWVRNWVRARPSVGTCGWASSQ